MDEEAREVSIRVIERVSRVEKCVSGVSSESVRLIAKDDNTTRHKASHTTGSSPLLDPSPQLHRSPSIIQHTSPALGLLFLL